MAAAPNSAELTQDPDIGGLLCACCPHGVVYGMKCLLRGESPRDHVDLALSFEHQPTLLVCDIPSFVARHGNKRVTGMFSPHNGRFAEATDDNIMRAKQDKLHISIPELDVAKLLFTQNPAEEEHSYAAPVHPLTGITDHYCAYDRFHEENTTNDIERLRRLDMVQECTAVNSQVVEELFSEIDKSRYFLTQMMPANHMFVLKLILHFRNIKKNKARLQAIERKVDTQLQGCGITFSADKRAVISPHVDAGQREVQGTGSSHSTPVVDDGTSSHPSTRRVDTGQREVQGTGSSRSTPLDIRNHPKTLKRTTQVYDVDNGTCGMEPRSKRVNTVHFADDAREPVILDIARHSDVDVVLASCGPYPLTASDFLSLEGKHWLTDQVIDAYIHVLCKNEPDVFHLPTQTMTQIINAEKYGSPQLLSKVDLSMYTKLVGVYHQGRSHWTALRLFCKSHRYRCV